MLAHFHTQRKLEILECCEMAITKQKREMNRKTAPRGCFLYEIHINWICIELTLIHKIVLIGTNWMVYPFMCACLFSSLWYKQWACCFIFVSIFHLSYLLFSNPLVSNRIHIIEKWNSLQPYISKQNEIRCGCLFKCVGKSLCCQCHSSPHICMFMYDVV